MGVGMCLYVQLVQTKDKQCKKCNYITMLSSVFISLLFPTPVNSNYGTFAPWSELSLAGAKVPFLELSLPRAKVLWNFRCRGTKVPGNFRPPGAKV